MPFSTRKSRDPMPDSFDAFLSYSRAVDGRLAPALQSALQRFTKPWYRIRALRVFRDNGSLSVNPDLWHSIETALQASGFFILLASPIAAQSRWVSREVETWLRLGRSRQVLLVLTDGEIHWDETTGDFDLERSTALPPSLSGAFQTEPNYLDLRWARQPEEHLSLDHNRFHDAVADLASAIHGRPKDELVGEHVRQHRTTLRWVKAIFVTLSILTVIALLAAVWALDRQAAAKRSEHIAKARLLTAQSELLQRDEPEKANLSIARAAAAVREFAKVGEASIASDRALRSAVRKHPMTVANVTLPDVPLLDLVFSEHDRELLVVGNRLHRLDPARQTSVEASWFRADMRFAYFSRDRRRIAFLDQQGAVHVANMDTQQVARIPGVVNASQLACSADAMQLAVVEGTQLKLIDLGNKRVLAHKTVTGVNQILFSPDGARLAVRLDSGGILIYRVPGLEEQRRIRYQGSLRAMNWSRGAESPLLLTGGREGHVWNPDSGKELFRSRHDDDVLDISMSSDGSRIATASGDGTVKVWDFPSGDQRQLLRHGSSIVRVLFDATGKRLATHGNGIHVWEVDSGRKLATVGLEPSINIAFSSNGQYLAAVRNGERPEVRIWDVDTTLELANALSLTGGDAFASDRDGALVASTGYRPGLFRIATRERLIKLEGSFASATTVSADGTTAAWAQEDEGISVYATNGTLLSRIGEPGIELIQLTRDGRRLVTSNRNSEIAVWSSLTGEEIFRIRHPPSNIIAHSISLDDQGKLLLTTTGASVALVHTLADGKEIARFPHDESTKTATLARNGSVAASASQTLLSVWNPGTGEMRFQGSHEYQITRVAIDPTASWVASASLDGTVRIWRIADGLEMARLVHPGNVVDAAFSEDGAHLATASRDGMARVWSVPVGEELAEIEVGDIVDRAGFVAGQRYVLTISGPDRWSGGVHLKETRIWPWQPEDTIEDACRRLGGLEGSMTGQHLNDLDGIAICDGN